MLEHITNIIGLFTGIYFGFIIYILFIEEFIHNPEEINKKEDEYKI